MDLLTVIFIAVGLSMDAFAVSVTSGFVVKRSRVKHAIRIAIFFGGFQGIMPVIGWLAGSGLRSYISGIDHWVAFVLLSLIGGRMIHEGLMGDEEEITGPRSYSLRLLLGLAIATSIDALAVGISLSLLDISIVNPAIIIGLVTFCFSLFGVYIGGRLGQFFGKKIEALGGLILIVIGIRILFQHLG